MKHRTYHSTNLRENLPQYADKMNVPVTQLECVYDWCLANDILFEQAGRSANETAVYMVPMDIHRRLPDPLTKAFFIELGKGLSAKLLPDYGLNWPTLVDRMRRVWEQVYNMVINKIPSHTLRVAWLRWGGAQIGKGSSIWRNTEVIGMESLVIGDDCCIGWHCQIDARSGLTIGNHVTIASHVLIVAGGHDLQAPEFWSVSAPIFIDDWVWITSRAMLLPGAHLGEGAVVSPNTTVGKRVEPYTIVGGNGKPMGTRARGLNYKVGGKSLFAFLH